MHSSRMRTTRSSSCLLWGCLPQCMLGYTSLGLGLDTPRCGPGHPSGSPPAWAWTPPDQTYPTSPPGLDLDPPRPDPQTSPLGLDLDKCPHPCEQNRTELTDVKIKFIVSELYETFCCSIMSCSGGPC